MLHAYFYGLWFWMLIPIHVISLLILYGVGVYVQVWLSTWGTCDPPRRERAHPLSEFEDLFAKTSDWRWHRITKTSYRRSLHRPNKRHSLKFWPRSMLLGFRGYRRDRAGSKRHPNVANLFVCYSSWSVLYSYVGKHILVLKFNKIYK